MIDAATAKPPAFGVIIVHSFSRFFRDQSQLRRTGLQESGRRPWRSRALLRHRLTPVSVE
jgi:hypothetical protein